MMGTFPPQSLTFTFHTLILIVTGGSIPLDYAAQVLTTTEKRFADIIPACQITTSTMHQSRRWRVGKYKQSSWNIANCNGI